MGETTAKHTQEQWLIKGPSPGGISRAAIVDAGDFAVYIKRDGTEYIIAEAFHRTGRTGENDFEPAEANANLMAAAPDLLDVTIESVTSEYWIDNASDLDCRMRLGYISESALAAIAKAEGESRC